MPTEQSVAIIGAGMAGLSCAVTLAVEWPKVVIFEKNSTVGGRIATVQQDGYTFDYGAQYFTAENDAFSARVSDWLREWSINEWNAWMVHLDNAQALSHRDSVKRYVGVPSMSAMLDSMAELCDVRFDTVVDKVKQDGDQWRLFSGKTDLGVFDHVIVAAPPSQAVKLMSIDATIIKQLKEVYLSPCWAVMLGFAQAQNLGFDGAFVVNSPISWMSRNNSKPDREAQESWVLHANSEWSIKNSALSEQKVIKELSTAMATVTGVNIEKPVFSQAYFWPEAKAVQLADVPYLYNKETKFGACGDWCLAPRIEGAFLSGLALANDLLSQYE